MQEKSSMASDFIGKAISSTNLPPNLQVPTTFEQICTSEEGCCKVRKGKGVFQLRRPPPRLEGLQVPEKVLQLQGYSS